MVATLTCRALLRRPIRCGETLRRTRIAELANPRLKAPMTGRGAWPWRETGTDYTANESQPLRKRFHFYGEWR
jgi:hypothetical protein